MEENTNKISYSAKAIIVSIVIIVLLAVLTLVLVNFNIIQLEINKEGTTDNIDTGKEKQQEKYQEYVLEDLSKEKVNKETEETVKQLKDEAQGGIIVSPYEIKPGEEQKLQVSPQKYDVNKKDLIIDANYTAPELVGKSYVARDDKTYSFVEKKIKLPFININSEDAKKANDEIYTIFMSLVAKFKENLNEKNKMNLVDWWYDYSYSYKVKENVLSLFIIDNGQNHAFPSKYNVFNFDVNTGKKVELADVIKLFEFTDTFENRAKRAIYTYEGFKEHEEHYNSMNMNGKVVARTLKDLSFDRFSKDFKENKLRFFIDSEGEFKIITYLAIPAGVGVFPTILTIK